MLPGERYLSMASKRRIIVVDPNQRLQQSHNFRYNKIVERNAFEAGFDVVFLFNKNDRSDFSGSNAKISYCFSNSSYDYSEIRSPYKRPRLARYGALATAAWRRLRGMNPPYALQVFPDVGRVLNFLLRAAIVILFPVLLLGLKIYNQLVYKRRPFLDDLFARELAAELAQVQPQSGDIIVLHSANFAMLEALFLLRPHLDLAAPYPCAVHAVFHHSMTERYGESFNLDYYQRAELTWLHRRLEVGFPFVALHLYATNEGLCRELSTLTGLQFNVFNHIEDLSKFGREIELAQFRTADTKAPRVGVRAKDVSKDNGAALSVALTRVRSAVPGAVFVVLGERGGDGIELQRLLSAVPGCVTVSTESDRDYLSEIRQLDILIQPYRPADYEKRISAVFVECALLGVSTVSPAGTTMAASTALAHVRSFEDLADLGAVIERTLADRAAADFGATRARHMAGAQAFYLRNAVSHDFAPEREPTVRIAAFGPIAALVTPFWGRCGSSTVFDSNTEYLLSRGYFVFRMMLSKDRVGIGSFDTIFKFYDENGRRVRAHVMLLASRTRRSLIRALATPSFWRESVFGQINRLNGFATDHDPALAAFAYRNAELVIVNHSFNVDYTRRFAKAKVVLEAQDIQAHQLAVQKARNLLVFRQDSEAEFLRDEIEVWRSVAATVNLSPTENAFIARYCPIALYPPVHHAAVHRSAPRLARLRHLEQVGQALPEDRAHRPAVVGGLASAQCRVDAVVPRRGDGQGRAVRRYGRRHLRSPRLRSAGKDALVGERVLRRISRLAGRVFRSRPPVGLAGPARDRHVDQDPGNAVHRHAVRRDRHRNARHRVWRHATDDVVERAGYARRDLRLACFR